MEKIIKMLKDSVQLLKVNDSDLIKRSVFEPTLSHRIAHYFENLLSNYSWYKKSPLTVDIEYDKNIDSDKVLPKEKCKNCDNTECYIKKEDYDVDVFREKCRPDIFLHERGTHDKNILVVEIKKKENENSDNKKYDCAKLSVLTCPKYEYKYEVGVFINNITENELEYMFFQNGKKTEGELSLKKIEDILKLNSETRIRT